jgi:hypothetical protein
MLARWVLIAGLGGSASMTAWHGSEAIRCSVDLAANLPREIGGPDAVCAAISEAALPALRRAGIPASAMSVKVRVVSDHRISGVASLDGRDLPEHVIDVADRSLNRRAIEMLAAAMAAEVSNSESNG